MNFEIIVDEQMLRRLAHSAGHLPPYKRLDLAMPYLKNMPEYTSTFGISVAFTSENYIHPRTEKPWRWRVVLEGSPLSVVDLTPTARYIFLSSGTQRSNQLKSPIYARIPDKEMRAILKARMVEFWQRLDQFVQYRVIAP